MMRTCLTLTGDFPNLNPFYSQNSSESLRHGVYWTQEGMLWYLAPSSQWQIFNVFYVTRLGLHRSNLFVQHILQMLNRTKIPENLDAKSTPQSHCRVLWTTSLFNYPVWQGALFHLKRPLLPGNIVSMKMCNSVPHRPCHPCDVE